MKHSCQMSHLLKLWGDPIQAYLVYFQISLDNPEPERKTEMYELFQKWVRD